MEYIKQSSECKIIQTKKTVEWLINNTEVRTFNKVTFEGYQRQVNENHVKGIAKYIIESFENKQKNKFFLPTSIICASNQEFSENTKLFIVDGQHRIEAFNYLYNKYREQYQKIKEFELSVIVLEEPSEALEVDTFITINKTSRKVDTSLAYILKGKISRFEKDLNNASLLSRQEYLAVELAIFLNENLESNWYGRIMLEGNPSKYSHETISLNSFVRSLRVLIRELSNYNVISLDWENEQDLNSILDTLKDFYLYFSKLVINRWPSLFTDSETGSVIQGSIGVSSLNKFLILKLKEVGKNFYGIDEIKKLLHKWIFDISIDESKWLRGNEFSKYSSEAGFNMIANILLDSTHR